MTLLEKYQKFLVVTTPPEIQPPHYTLLAEGWKLLIKENITPMIEEKLQMRQIGDYVWVDDYKDGRRRVLSFFKVNDAYATFQWGWNFDFVPKGRKAVWARTDKSIFTHIYEVSPDFYNAGSTLSKESCRARNRIMMGRYFNDGIINSSTPERGGLLLMINHHKSVFLHVLPLIIEYYHSTVSYEGILKRIELNMQNGYYRFINSQMYITRAFVEKRMGLQEKARQDFEEIQFVNEDIKNLYFKKFNLLT